MEAGIEQAVGCRPVAVAAVPAAEDIVLAAAASYPVAAGTVGPAVAAAVVAASHPEEPVVGDTPGELAAVDNLEAVGTAAVVAGTEPQEVQLAK